MEPRAISSNANAQPMVQRSCAVASRSDTQTFIIMFGFAFFIRSPRAFVGAFALSIAADMPAWRGAKCVKFQEAPQTFPGEMRLQANMTPVLFV
jgi:hypothetical protein